MTCRSCGLEIAEKAIVCYRCGAPTADPRAAGPAHGPARRAKWQPAVLLGAAAVLAAWSLLRTTPEAPVRWVGWGLTGILGLLAVLTARRASARR